MNKFSPSLQLKSKGIISIILLLFFQSGISNNNSPILDNQVDIELSISASTQNPAQFSIFSVTTTVNNNGSETATEVVVELPITNIDDLVYSGGDEFTASQGSFFPYGTEIWEVGDIAAGASATLTTNYFVMGENVYTLYGEVLNHNEIDVDSQPNNGTAPIPNEDDEAAVAFNTDTPSCSITATAINIVCNDTGTPDPLDDNFFFDVLVTGSNTPSDTWVADIPPLFGTQGSSFSDFYNNSQTRALSIRGVNDLYGGTIVVDVYDSVDNDCSTTLSISAPPYCSDGIGCSIAGLVFSFNTVCNDQGTATPDDDTFDFSFIVSGVENASTFILTGDLPQPLTLDYNTVYEFTDYPAGGSFLSFTVTDFDNPSCTDNFFVAPPDPCSTGSECDISIVNLEQECFSMGTPETSDDLMIVSLELTGVNTAIQWSAELPGNPSNAGGSSITNSYDLMSGVASYFIEEANQFFNGGPISFTAIDNNDPNCTEEITFDIIPTCSDPGGFDIDLELAVSSSNPNPNQFSNVTIQVDVVNNSNVLATLVEVEVPKPDGLIYQGGNEFSATQGNFQFNSSQIWNVLNLAPGESATLEVNYFILGEPNGVVNYAQVVDVDQPDVDSSPNNGTPPTVNEDDEGVVIFGGVNLPDLTLSNLSLPGGEATIGEDSPFSFDLNNIGTADVVGDYRIGAFLSTDNSFSNDDILVGEILTGNTAVGSTPGIAGLFNAEVGTLAGNYFFLLVADDLEVINESNENNNSIITISTIELSDPIGGCEISVEVVDIECQNQGTLDDPSDDTFTAIIMVSGTSECFGNYKIDGMLGGIFNSQAVFGERAFLGPFPISNGDVTILVTDVNDENGVSVTLPAPISCSNGANPNECGFVETYPTIPDFLNLRRRIARETENGYEIELLGNSSSAPTFTYYDISTDFTGDELILEETQVPFPYFRRNSENNLFRSEIVVDFDLEIALDDSNGNEIWSNIFTFNAGIPQGSPEARDVIELDDGYAFLIAANGVQDVGWILKTDFDGSLLFQEIIQFTDGFLEYYFHGLASNGDFYVYRQSASRVGHLIRIDSQGIFIYEEGIVGDLVTNRLGGFSETNDGNFIYASYKEFPTTRLEKLNAFTGELEWIINVNNTFSPEGNFTFSSKGNVVATSDGGAVVGYAITSPEGDPPAYEYGRVNAEGNLVWWRHLETGYLLDAALETSDGGFLFIGPFDTEYRAVKVTSEGLLSPTCVDTGTCDIGFEGILSVCDDNGTPNDPSDDVWFAHINPQGTGLGATFNITGNITAEDLLYGQNYIFGPYPNDPFLNIAFAITDESGNCSSSFILVSPGACSFGSGCQISGTVVSVDCSNEGTPNDPSDDTWGFIINVTGTNNSNNWNLDFDGGFYIGLYDQDDTFSNLPLTGPETVVLDIYDQADVNCTTTITIDAPFPCDSGNELADVELDVSSNSSPGAFEFVSFDVTITNTGNADANGLTVFVPIPDDVVLQGGNEFSVTAGEAFGINSINWFLSVLSPGQTETLTINYFTLNAIPTTCYAQVFTMIGDDPDSSPGNGTPPIPNEDDEAAFTLGDSSPDCLLTIMSNDFVCNDNGTADPLDDTFTIQLIAQGNGADAGTGWTTNIQGVNYSANYGDLAVLGPFLISSANFPVTLFDNQLPECSKDFFTDIQGPCSTSGNEADLSLDLQSDLMFVSSDLVTHTITISNAGPSDATNVQVEFYQSPSFFVSFVSSTNGTFSPPTSSEFIWTIPTVAAGTSETLILEEQFVDFEFSATSVTPFCEIIASDNPDPDSSPDNDNGDKIADEDDEAATEIFPKGNLLPYILLTELSTSSPIVSLNETFTIDLSVTASSSAFSVNGVLAEIQVPNTLEVLSAIPSQGVFDANTGLWDAGYFLKGTSAILTLEVTLIDDSQPSIIFAEIESTEGLFDLNSTHGNGTCCIANEDDEAVLSIETGGEFIDLELSGSFNPIPESPYQNFSVDFTVTNEGNVEATGIVLHIPQPSGSPLQGGNEYTVTQGQYWAYTTFEWEVGSLVPGASATITLNYFMLGFDDEIDIYAEVSAVDQNDVDSTPGNFVCCSPSEDDEAVLTAVPSSSSQNVQTNGEVIDLKAQASGDFISEIFWLHNKGKETDYYVLERSLDGIYFHELSTEVSRNTNTHELYSHYDLEPALGNNFYRLKLIRSDGSEDFSNTVLVYFNDLIDFQLFPNPTTGIVKVNLEAIEGINDVEIEIYNNLGQQKELIHIPKVLSKYHQIDLRHFREGMYWVNLKMRGRRSISKRLAVMKPR